MIFELTFLYIDFELITFKLDLELTSLLILYMTSKLTPLTFCLWPSHLHTYTFDRELWTYNWRWAESCCWWSDPGSSWPRMRKRPCPSAPPRWRWSGWGWSEFRRNIWRCCWPVCLCSKWRRFSANRTLWRRGWLPRHTVWRLRFQPSDWDLQWWWWQWVCLWGAK